MGQIDPVTVGVIVAVISAVLSLMGTLYMAIANIKSAQINASDSVATGASVLLEEFRKERAEMKSDIADLKQWKKDVTGFIMPFIDGSKRNENQLIQAGITPVYSLPPIPKWLKNNGNVVK